MKDLTLKGLHEGLKTKKFSSEEITREYLKIISSKNEDIHAYLEVSEDSALEEARKIDLTLAKGGDLPVLAGLPIALKDNMLVEGRRVTAASKILEHYISSYDAHVTKCLGNQGAIFLGKTNLDEFAMGSSTENSAYGTTKNPHDLTRIPGGSSGGSTAAVAAGMALAALGSDTGGSIRQPAALCGVVGLKPTYGAVSRHGLIAMASSLDQIGPITKTVEDAAILFDGIRGVDVFDSTSAGALGVLNPLHYDPQEIKKLKIGIPKEYFTPDLDPQIAKAMEDVMDRFKSLGFELIPVSLPNVRHALSVYYIIMPAEVSTNLARFDGIRYSRTNNKQQKTNNLKDIYFATRGEGFGDEVKRRILLGAFVLSSGYYDAYYAKAQRVRALIKADFDEAFKNVDLILAPTTPSTAFKIGEKTEDPVSMYLSDIFTIPANLAGIPAISIPVKRYEVGSGELPIGFQLMGKHFHERDILGMGRMYEETNNPGRVG